MLNNLTNEQLQAAIDSFRGGAHPQHRPHVDALLAEQIRRLNAEEILPKTEQPSVDEWEYVWCWLDKTNNYLTRLHHWGQMPNALEYVLSAFVGKFHEGQLAQWHVYGIYKRKDATPWQLITDSEGVLPQTVEEIN